MISTPWGTKAAITIVCVYPERRLRCVCGRVHSLCLARHRKSTKLYPLQLWCNNDSNGYKDSVPIICSPLRSHKNLSVYVCLTPVLEQVSFSKCATEAKKQAGLNCSSCDEIVILPRSEQVDCDLKHLLVEIPKFILSCETVCTCAYFQKDAYRPLRTPCLKPEHKGEHNNCRMRAKMSDCDLPTPYVTG